MKLKTRIFVTFFIIILVPSILTLLLQFGVAFFKRDMLLSTLGIDVMHLTHEARVLLVCGNIAVICILMITGLILGVWLMNGVVNPLSDLAKATRNISEGNLDFEVRVEGVKEIRELCQDFEDMRMKLKLANMEKLEVDDQNRELISNITHDLKTPITAIKGYVEGIMDGIADTPEKMDRYIRTIYNKTNDLDRLINELTFYSKINTNRVPYNFDKINVKGFFEDAAEELEYDLKTKGVEFEYSCTVGPDVQVITDVEQMRRVLSNIVGNSVKYMDKSERKVALNVRDAGDEIEVAVSDNGKGISQDDIKYIFDRFYRADSSRNSGKGGSGIGLSIVRKIVEDHGGRVWAESVLGEGTTMTFTLRKYE